MQLLSRPGRGVTFRRGRIAAPGVLAQLVERRHGMAEVRSSSLLDSIQGFRRLAVFSADAHGLQGLFTGL